MWTPKRIVLLAVGFFLFFSSYLGYSRSFLGGIDGLPALPEAYHRSGSDAHLPPPPPRGRRVEEKLKQAFGLECPELNRPIKLELRSRSMVLAADRFTLEEDGWRVVLSPISVAVFGKPGAGGHWPEINTIRGTVAYLTLDRPVSNLTEVSGRKIVGAELSGNIEVVNNRRTSDRTDDLFVYIGTGPLYYDDAKHFIWTHDMVHLKDLQSKPKPNEIWGKGLEVQLEGPPEGAERGPARGSKDSVGGVKQIVLLSNVDMYFYVDSRSGFLGASKSPAAKQEPPRADQPPEKSHIHIKTPGRFQYDFFKDHDQAQFSIPPADPRQPLRSPQHVVVKRHHATVNAADHLMCQHLDIRLRRKAALPQDDDRSGSPEQKLDIEHARATGPEVLLTSDLEHLEARGQEFIYDAAQLVTTLRGEPQMEAVKDNSIIYARELQIREKKGTSPTGQPLSWQETFAKGPGRIDLYDRATEKNTVHAFWNDQLISTRDGVHDLLILTGAARFIDDANNQTLQAEMLKVWLNPREETPTAGGTVADGSVRQSRRPHHVEAVGNVLARSKEMHVHNTTRLVVWFKDVAVVQAELPVNPASAPPTPGLTPAAQQSQLPEPGGKAPPEGKAPPAAATTPPPAGTPESENNRPIDLSARSVEAWVLRTPLKNTLEKLWTEGSVHVRQAPARPGEKGVDIQGDTLRMDYHPEGNFLVVTGDLAQLRMDKIFILGPEVNIDQATNKAWVNGAGAMQMDSTTSLAGSELEKNVPLTVHWARSMLFDGQSADFRGSIQAEQEASRLACQKLQVFFDQPISLKEGNRGKSSARVKHLVCHGAVRLEENVVEKEVLVKYQRLEARTVSMNALEKDESATPDSEAARESNEVRASGPGVLRIYQQGDQDPLAAPPAQTPTPAAPPPEAPPSGSKAKKDEMKLTYVEFGTSMYANNRSRTATFWGNVRVLNLPTKNPQMEISLDTLLDALPEDAMYLSCAQLTVLDRGEKGRSQQEMRARGQVSVQAEKFWGRADTVTYNEAKDQIIFDGGDEGLATLYKIMPKGAPPQEIKGRKITYLRSTGAFKIDEGRWIFGN